MKKNKTVLPDWLDKCIFNSLNGRYAPNFNRYDYNLDLNEEEVRVYLGTYFPRSYAEIFCIIENLCHNKVFHDVYAPKQEINILDIGCGTGGDLVGLLISINKYYSNLRQVNVTAVDGNNNALIILGEIIRQLKHQVRYQISINVVHKVILSPVDLRLQSLDKGFDFIICGKIGCELKSRNVMDDAYLQLARCLTPQLSDNGIFILLDVTTMNYKTRLFFPQEMNGELNIFVREQYSYKTLLPLSCSIYSNCNISCFMQQSFYISHSMKQKDESKVCYRILCSTNFHRIISPLTLRNEKYIISPSKNNQNVEDGICVHGRGTIVIDSFDINIKT